MKNLSLLFSSQWDSSLNIQSSSMMPPYNYWAVGRYSYSILNEALLVVENWVYLVNEARSGFKTQNPYINREKERENSIITRSRNRTCQFH